ncbi:MAG: hypothetical protein Kow0063_09310 [Anaerolineae bacterium]
MRVCSRLFLGLVLLGISVGCGRDSSLPTADELVARARSAWAGDWHAVWQVEWDGAPLRGPLVFETWHAADGRLRIEILEAPALALDSLVLVDDGAERWLYSTRENDWVSKPNQPARIPLAEDALEMVDWLLLRVPHAALDVSARNVLESGPAIRLEVVLADGERATLWVHEATGLPSRVELHSATWGEPLLATRSISPPGYLNPGLFVPPVTEVSGVNLYTK